MKLEELKIKHDEFIKKYMVEFNNEMAHTPFAYIFLMALATTTSLLIAPFGIIVYIFGIIVYILSALMVVGLLLKYSGSLLTLIYVSIYGIFYSLVIYVVIEMKIIGYQNYPDHIYEHLYILYLLILFVMTVVITILPNMRIDREDDKNLAGD